MVITYAPALSFLPAAITDAAADITADDISLPPFFILIVDSPLIFSD